MKKKAQQFSTVQIPKPASSTFDLSHDIKTSLDMGFLVPTAVMEVLPGDKFNITCENMLRFQPLVSPVMHKVKVKTNYFFVPNRILWSNWEYFITGNQNGLPVEPPYLSGGEVGVERGTVADYMGIPLNLSGSYNQMNALPYAAYLKIFDEYYRDQNLQQERFTPLTDGRNANLEGGFFSPPLRRAWEHDYFTSALPFAQKGDQVTLPLTDDGLVEVKLRDTKTGTMIMNDATGDSFPNSSGNPLRSGTAGVLTIGTTQAWIDPNGQYTVDINEEAVAITTLRRALMLQQFLETDARAGTRYVESLKAHFNVNSSDKRMQRPEYIGGAVQNMSISEVLSTAQSVDTTTELENQIPLGQMAGHGISVGSGKNLSYTAEEHGFIIGLISVIPDTAYQQGLHKMWSRNTQLDYAFPTFANIGEQEVLSKEIYLQNNEIDDEVFGYMPRYSEYRYLNSRVSGDMRTSLDYWHLGRIFETRPVLSGEFVECRPSKRIFAVEDEDVHSIVAHIYQNVTVNRRLPANSNPHI